MQTYKCTEAIYKNCSYKFVEGLIDYFSDCMHSPQWISILGDNLIDILSVKFWLWMIYFIRCMIIVINFVIGLLHTSRLVVLSFIDGQIR
jgi:hypothetical protein